MPGSKGLTPHELAHKWMERSLAPPMWSVERIVEVRRTEQSRWYYLVLLLCKNMKKKPAGRILEDTAMTINTDQLLESILDSLDRIDYVKSEDIPDIQLYMVR